MFYSNATSVKMLATMLTIRLFEEKVDELFAAGELKGTSHLAAGQEATAVGASFALQQGDYVTSNHRGHGHFIARGGDPNRIMAELFGRETGYSHGRGGTQHMADFSLGFLGMNGITGGMLPIAVGAAFSAKYHADNKVALAFFGDGASNQGTFHESMNLAACYQLPIIFFCENNLYAMSTPAREMVSVENIADRASGYGMPGITVDGNDVDAVFAVTAEAATKARQGGGPTLIEAKTYRILGHSRGDLRVYRTREEEAEWAILDPIARYAQNLLTQGIITETEWTQLYADMQRIIDDSVEFSRRSTVLVG